MKNSNMTKKVKDLRGYDEVYKIKSNHTQYESMPDYPFVIMNKVLFGVGRNKNGEVLVHFEEPDSYNKGIVQELESSVVKDKYQDIYYLNYEDAYKALRRKICARIEHHDSYVRKLRRNNYDILNGPIKTEPNA